LGRGGRGGHDVHPVLTGAVETRDASAEA
jgi:hypothetical protein